MTRSIVGFTRISLVAEWRSAEIRVEAGLSKLPELWVPLGTGVGTFLVAQRRVSMALGGSTGAVGAMRGSEGKQVDTKKPMKIY